MTNIGVPRGEVKLGIPPLEIEAKNQTFVENIKSAAQFPVNLTLPTTLYLPVRHSHCTRARFTVLVACSDELAVH